MEFWNIEYMIEMIEENYKLNQWYQLQWMSGKDSKKNLVSAIEQVDRKSKLFKANSQEFSALYEQINFQRFLKMKNVHRAISLT